MKSKTTTSILRGTLVALVLGLVMWSGTHAFLRHGSILLGIEPRYEGKPLGYWCENAFHYYGSQQIANDDATEALQNMKNGAIPFLVKWIGTVNHSSQGPDHESLALDAFRILGPQASPAIPGLIKVIGRNNNWPPVALSYIGADAVPALIEVLVTNQTPDTFGDWRQGNPPNQIREMAILALAYMGTNAEAALPVLLICAQNEAKLSRADVATALARIGHNHPEQVVPALIQLLTNSTAYRGNETSDALASFGDKAKSAVPTLLAEGKDPNAWDRDRAAIAVKTISPQTPDALAPFVADLTNQDVNIRRNCFHALEMFGTNWAEAWNAAVESSLHDPDAETRELAIRCVIKLKTNVNEILPVVRQNITNENRTVANTAAEGLCELARSSKPLFLELVALSENSPSPEVRGIADSGVNEIIKEHPNYLIEWLDNSNTEVRARALRKIDKLSHETLVTRRYEPEPSTNYQVYVMREINGRYKLEFINILPSITKGLHDEDLEIRKLTTNVLQEIDPKAAKEAGVIVVPPYSFYAN